VGEKVSVILGRDQCPGYPILGKIILMGTTHFVDALGVSVNCERRPSITASGTVARHSKITVVSGTLILTTPWNANVTEA